jgi:hypothetical protein
MDGPSGPLECSRNGECDCHDSTSDISFCTILLQRKFFLESTLMELSASVDSKPLTLGLSPLGCNTYEKPGGQTDRHFFPQTGMLSRLANHSFAVNFHELLSLNSGHWWETRCSRIAVRERGIPPEPTNLPDSFAADGLHSPRHAAASWDFLG